jgi:hypothetical protein
MRVEVSAGGRALQAATTGVAVAYSPELRYLGTDLGFLQQVAEAGGGAVLSSARQALAEPVPPVDLDQPLWGALLVLAIVLLPLDVALRRLDLRRAPLPAPRTEDVSDPGPRQATRAPSPGSDPPGPSSETEPVLATRLLERLKR